MVLDGFAQVVHGNVLILIFSSQKKKLLDGTLCQIHCFQTDVMIGWKKN